MKIFSSVLIILFLYMPLQGRSQDSSVVIPNTKEVSVRWYKKNPYKAFIAPTVLVGLGVLMIKNPVYDRFNFYHDLFKVFPGFKGTKVDNYLIFAPYAELALLNISKIPCENDLINTSLLIAKSELIMAGLVFGLKYVTHIQRPNKQNYYSFPSGHTAEAFVAATIVNREFRYKSPWIGVGAYGVAVSVGMFRMLNDKHWLSDVLAGAGIGILSANLAYITHKWRWGRPGTCLVPFINQGKPGFLFTYSYKF